MHFAVGMGCAGLTAGLGCLIARRGYRWIPAAMTLGGVWALVPDLPRIFREDFPSLPFASTLGAKSLERWLHSHGDVFFFHYSMDQQPREFALHGLFLIIMMYNAALLMGWLHNRRVRKAAEATERRFQAHRPMLENQGPNLHLAVEDPVIGRI